MLGGPATPTIGVTSESGLPVIALKTVSVPDYLDSTDILRRTGANELTPSPEGRWGERLSQGLTHALASSLSRQLPRTVISTAVTPEPKYRIFVDIENFDIDVDGRCLIAARWRITTGDGKGWSTSEHGTFSQAAKSIDDPAIAAAMSLAVDQLATEITRSANLE